MRINEVDRELTQTELDQLETFADRLFAKVGIDVEFTRHFLDRVNDERNVKQITASELTRLFKQEYKKWGKDIVKLGPDAEAVLKDLATDVNIPFALRWDNANNELDLIAKTVMRKQDFKTSNREFAIEEVVPMLYHATYRPFLESIMKNGLGGSGAQTQWEDSKPGYVYLAKDPEIASSHAEANEEVPDEYIDDIVVLSIDASQLDQDNLENDPNVQDDDSTLAYKGIIPTSAFSIQESYKLSNTQSKLVFESIQQLNEAGPAAIAVPAGIVAWQAYSAYRYSKAAWWVAQGAYATATTAAAYIVANEADFSWLERKMAASALLAYELWDKVRGVEDLSNEIVSDTNDKLNSELVAGTEVLTKQALETNSISAETAEIIAQTNAAADKMNQQIADGVDPETIAKDYVASLVTNKAAEETVKQIAVVSPEVVSAIQTELENNYQDASGQRASEIAAQQKAVELAQAKADAQTKASDANLIALANNVAKAQADAKATELSDKKLIALGQTVAQANADDRATKASDEKLIALGNAVAQQQASDAQTKASDDKLIALANKVAATQAQQANDKYQNDKIDDIATKSDAAAKADAQTKASDANLIAKGQAYAQAQADAQAKAKADAQTKASDANLIAKGQAYAQAQADAKAKADAAANDKYQNDKIDNIATTSDNNFVRDLEKNPLPVADFTPKDITTTGDTTVKEPIKVGTPPSVIVQPEIPAVDYPDTNIGTNVVDKPVNIPHDRTKILVPPFVANPPKIDTKAISTAKVDAKNKKGGKRKGGDGSMMGYNDLYKTNLYKWTQQYGTFENDKLNKMLLGENSISTRVSNTRNKTGNGTNQTFSKYISKTSDTGGTSLSKVSNLNKTANGTTGTTTKRFIRPGGSGTNTTYDHGTGKVTRTNVQLKGPQSWMYDKKLNSSVTKEAQAVAGGKVHKNITGHNLTWKGVKQEKIDFELISIDNATKSVKLGILRPEEFAGEVANVSFKTLRRGPFVKTELNESIIMEGGAMPGVGAIHIDEINPTLEQLEKSLGLDLKDFTLGSVGKRQFSGDIDVALNLPPEELPAFVEKLKKNPLIKDIAKSSVIMTKVQIQNFDKSKSDGRPRTGFVQVDFMPGDPGWLKTYFHSPSEDESKYKGVFRNVMVATMAAVHNRDDSQAEVEDGRPLESRRFMWSPTDGLVRVLRTPVPAKNGNGYTKKNQNKVIDGPWKQADEIAKQLGLNSAKDLNSFESLLDAMKKSYTQEEQKKVIDNLKDSKVVQDIGIPDEIKDL
jgi:hypothetical protein